MFIKRTLTKRIGERRYYTHRLFWSERVKGRAVRYNLNLGANYPVPKEQWRDLCSILERLTDDEGQQLLFDFEPPNLVVEAHYLYRQIITKQLARNITEAEEATG